MSHAHLPVQHLLQQLEKRGRSRQRDVRPQWIRPIIDEVAELFEPISGVGRVGFDCRLGEDRWELSFYLGACEVMGGQNDGQARPLNFQFDLHQLSQKFNLVERFDWTAYPNRIDMPDEEAVSMMTIEGYWADNPIRLNVFETSPPQVGPGLREYPDGRREQV